QLQLVHRQRLRRDGAEHRAHAVDLPHHIDAEASELTQAVGKISAIVAVEALLRLRRHDLEQRIAHEIRRQRLPAQRCQIAPQPDAWWITGHEVQVRAPALEYLCEEFVDLRHRYQPPDAGPACVPVISSLGSRLVSVTYFCSTRLSLANR